MRCKCNSWYVTDIVCMLHRCYVLNELKSFCSQSTRSFLFLWSRQITKRKRAKHYHISSKLTFPIQLHKPGQNKNKSFYIYRITFLKRLQNCNRLSNHKYQLIQTRKVNYSVRSLLDQDREGWTLPVVRSNAATESNQPETLPSTSESADPLQFFGAEVTGPLFRSVWIERRKLLGAAVLIGNDITSERGPPSSI